MKNFQVILTAKQNPLQFITTAGEKSNVIWAAKFSEFANKINKPIQGGSIYLDAIVESVQDLDKYIGSLNCSEFAFAKLVHKGVKVGISDGKAYADLALNGQLAKTHYFDSLELLCDAIGAQ